MIALHLHYTPVAFALFFFLLAMWSAHVSSKEGFMNASSTVDWVTNSKRWFVEKVLMEKPLAIQEKDVATYPVSGLSAQSATSSGTT
jgi:hypothetical protein